MFSFVTTALQSVLHNPTAAGFSIAAVSATVIGSIMYGARQVPRKTWDLFLRYGTVELTVNSGEIAFDWLESWLNEHLKGRKPQRVILRGYNTWSRQSDTYTTSWKLVPGAGSHWVWLKGRLFYMHRRVNDQPAGSRDKPLETIELRTLGRSLEPIELLVKEAYASKDADIITVPIWVWDHRWRALTGKSPRSLDSIVMAEGKLEKLLNDLSWFTKAGKWYSDRGIPYRRGYLFSGPPGTGKTSIVLGIASHLKRPVCVLNLSTLKDDSELLSAIAEANSNAIILIEDIDCACHVATDISESEDSITRAGLLNALDGISVPDGRIFIMTTNHPENLDLTLIRPGRVDFHETFDLLGYEEQRVMAHRFYEGKSEFEPLPYPVSAAELQTAFMLYPEDPFTARIHLLKK